MCASVSAEIPFGADLPPLNGKTAFKKYTITFRIPFKGDGVRSAILPRAAAYA